MTASSACAATELSVTRPIAGWKGLPAFVLAEADVTRDPDGLVRIPYLLPDGGLYAARIVAPNGRRWWQPGDGRPVIPFGLERLARPGLRKYRALAIVEGESDALALWAALGHEGMDVLGVPGARTWRPEWAEHAAGYETVYVCGDGDDSGHDLNWSVRRDLPDAIIVELPEGRDLRAVIQEDGVGALLSLVGWAERHDEICRAVLEARDLPDCCARLGIGDDVAA